MDSTPLTAAFARPGWFHVVLLFLAIYFAYLAGVNFISYHRGTPFAASAACLYVLARRGGPATGGPAVAALGLLRRGCPTGVPTSTTQTTPTRGVGNGSLCVTFPDGLVAADGYYFITNGPGSSPALDPVRGPATLRSSLRALHTTHCAIAGLIGPCCDAARPEESLCAAPCCAGGMGLRGLQWQGLGRAGVRVSAAPFRRGRAKAAKVRRERRALPRNTIPDPHDPLYAG